MRVRQYLLISTLFAFILSSLLLLPLSTFAQVKNEVKESQSAPGVIGSLRVLIENSRSQVTDTYQKLKSSSQIELNPTVETVKNTKVAPEFMRSIFLHSEKRFLSLINSNECHFYSLLENGLLKSSLGQVDFLIMESPVKKFLIRYDQYIEQIYKTKCQHFSQFSKIFNKENLKKTINSLKLDVPNNRDQCKNILIDWRKNDYLPYMCKIPTTINKAKRAQLVKKSGNDLPLSQIRLLNTYINSGEFYTSEIDFFKRSYIDNLCKGLSNEEKFCDAYLATDAWSKVLNGELQKNILTYRCNNLYSRDEMAPLSATQVAKCVKKIKDSPHLCTTESANGFSSLYPRPNCSLISIALKDSRLKTDYRDCPGQIDNGAITNIHRIMAHFTGRDIVTSNKACQAEANYSLLKLEKDAKVAKEWPLKICYFDKIDNEEVCHTYIPGSLKKADNSEDQIITKILKRMNKIESRISCNVISKKQFKPVLLEYKNGCYVVFDENNCSNSYCPKDIMVDNKKIEGISYKGSPAFDYVPNNWRDAKKSAIESLNKAYKLESKRIRNLTELKVFLRKYENAIVHGIGCAEDMLPRYFNRKSFNSCSVLPFIIDGSITQNENMILVTRTSIDDNHSPRLIPWNWIFSAVMRYQQLHPLKQWSLYGIKK